MRRKDLGKRILVSTLIIIMLFNFIIPVGTSLNVVYADNKTIRKRDLTDDQWEKISTILKALGERDGLEDGETTGYNNDPKDYKGGEKKTSFENMARDLYYEPDLAALAGVTVDYFREFLDYNDDIAGDLQSMMANTYNSAYRPAYDRGYTDGNNDYRYEEWKAEHDDGEEPPEDFWGDSDDNPNLEDDANSGPGAGTVGGDQQGSNGGSSGSGTSGNGSTGTGDGSGTGTSEGNNSGSNTGTSENPGSADNAGETSTSPEDRKTEYQNKIDALIESRTNGPAEALGWAVWKYIVGFFSSIQEIIFSVASSGGLNTTDVSSYITPLDIFFNKFTLTDINIFSTTAADGTELNQDGLVYKLRHNAAFWYYAFRSIALGALLIMFIINLIAAISSNSTADQKRVAKNALKDWVISMALVMFMHILIIFIINVNNAFIGVIENISGASEIGDIMDSMLDACFSSSFILRCAALIVYVLMIYQTAKYLLIYIQRFLTTFFLVVASPLIPVIYSTEKTIGNRSVALNGWFRELLANVFLQLVHCIVYVVMVGAAMTAFASKTTEVSSISDLGPAVIAILSLFFISHAEGLMRSILGFNNATTVSNNILQSARDSIYYAATGREYRNPYSPQPQNSVLGMGVKFGQNVGSAVGGMAQGVQGGSLGENVTRFKDRAFSAANSFMAGFRNNGAQSSSEESSEENLPANDNTGDNAGSAGEEGGLPSNVLPVVVDGASTLPEQNSTNSEDENIEKSKMEELDNVVKSTTEKRVEEDEKREKHVEETEETETSSIIVSDDPKILEDFKAAFAKIQSDNEDVQKWGEEINSKLDELDGLKDLLSNEEANKIENDIDNMGSLEEIQAYVAKLGPDTLQGQYANKYADWKQYDALDDEIVNNKRNLINEYREKGLQIDDNLATMLTTSEGAKLIDKLQATSSEDSEQADDIDVGVIDENTDLSEAIDKLESQMKKINDSEKELRELSANLSRDAHNEEVNRANNMKKLDDLKQSMVAFRGEVIEATKKSSNVDMNEIAKKFKFSENFGFKSSDIKKLQTLVAKSLDTKDFGASFQSAAKNLGPVKDLQKTIRENKKLCDDYYSRLKDIESQTNKLRNAKVTITTQMEKITTSTTTTVSQTKVTGPTDSTNKVLEDLRRNAGQN